MKYVLYNNSDRVRKLPKFNYEGKFDLKPKAAVEISQEMVAFYQPYRVLGVAVRAIPAQTEPETKKTEDEDVQMFLASQTPQVCAENPEVFSEPEPVEPNLSAEPEEPKPSAEQEEPEPARSPKKKKK